MSEVNATRRCSYCGKNKVWNITDLRLKDGSKIYVDQNGRRWAGRRCPDCERKRVQKAIRCDNFEREHILFELQNAGYEILSHKLPFKVRKDGEKLTVGIKRAITRDGQIIVEEELEKNADIFVLLFESIRIFETPTLEKLGNRIIVADPEKTSFPKTKINVCEPNVQ